jgi:hypothetical protein
VTPELRVFLFAAAAMIFAYMALYPRLPKKTIFTMFALDLVLTAAILLAVGVIYFGTGTGFSLFFFDVPWWLFTFLSAAVVEVPLYLWFCKRWNVDLKPPVD